MAWKVIDTNGNSKGVGPRSGWSVIDTNGYVQTDVLESAVDHGGLGGLSDDDHTQYVLVSNLEADRATIVTNWDDLTDAGFTTLHKHAFTSARETQVATAGQTVFTLTSVTYTPGAGDLAVYINGVRQHPAAYTETNTTTVTMSSGVSNGSSVYFEVGGGGGGTGNSFSTINVSDYVVINGDSGDGIKVDTTTPTYPWHDMLGSIETRGAGANDPNWATFRTNINSYQFDVNDECWIVFHMPHDYAPGTDLHLHYHWALAGTTTTGGSVTWGYNVSYSKGHDQAAFPATTNGTVVGNASTTQYQHIITEVQITASSPSGSQFNNSVLEVDGLLLVRVYLSANNVTVSGGAAPKPFLFNVDIHYQSTNIGTKNKVPGFYT